MYTTPRVSHHAYCMSRLGMLYESWARLSHARPLRPLPLEWARLHGHNHYPYCITITPSMGTPARVQAGGTHAVGSGMFNERCRCLPSLGGNLRHDGDG